jgi:hypothetical protein
VGKKIEGNDLQDVQNVTDTSVQANALNTGV